MNKKWQIMAGNMLVDMADVLSCRGCNDWKWPEQWTQDERRELATQMVIDNVRKRSVDELTDEEKADIDNFVKDDGSLTIPFGKPTPILHPVPAVSG